RQDRRQRHHRGRHHGGAQERRGGQDHQRAARPDQGVPHHGGADDQRRRADRRSRSDAGQDRGLLRGRGGYGRGRLDEAHRADHDHHPRRDHRHDRDGDVPAALLDPDQDHLGSDALITPSLLSQRERREALTKPRRGDNLLMTPLVRQLRWYIAIRVVAIVSVLLPFGLFQLWVLPTAPPAESSLVGPPAPSSIGATEMETLPRDILWLLGGATFGATLLYIGLLRLLRRHPTAQAYIQFFGDLVLITGLVYFLGGAASPFSLLYLIVIA